MTGFVPPPTPAILEVGMRVAGDAWTGSTALTYTVTTPIVYAADGVTVTTPAGPLNLAGYTVVGSAMYQRRGAPLKGCPVDIPANVPTVAMTGEIVDPVNGIISLSLTAAQSAVFPKQDPYSWIGPTSDPRKALLLVRPQIVDANGNPVTVGYQPLYVL